MEENNSEILGCFVSGPATYYDTEDKMRVSLEQKGAIFRSYIWGEYGICLGLKKLRRSNYGKDLKLVLFQFYLFPLLEELVHLKEIERYRRSERAIGIPIIIHDANFFDKSDYERRAFLKDVILEKLELLEEVATRNKLDTNIELLKCDIAKALS